MRVMIYLNDIIIITCMQQFDKENLKLFAKHIKKIRKNKSKSLNKLAFSRGGVTSAILSRIENGLVDFKFSTLVKIASALEIPLKEILRIVPHLLR